MKNVKGYIPKKEEQRAPDFGAGVGSVAILINDLRDVKHEVVKEVNDKIKEVDTLIENATNTIEQNSTEVCNLVEEAKTVISDLKTEAIDTIKEIKQGEPGKDADETAIIDTVLAKIPKLDEAKLTKDILSKVPKAEKIDEDKLLTKFLTKIPQNKASLKIIKEHFEADPMSVIEKIMALPEEKLKKFRLKTDNIDGLEQTMSAFRNQLGRGYLHGGGISNITGLIQAGTNITITGLGTSSSPYIINSSGGGGGTPGGSNTQVQYNNNGSFGGITGLTTNGNIITYAPTARTSGATPYLTITAPNDTGITASTESKGINIVGATRTWSDGTVALQREYFFGKPTYNKTTTSAVFTVASTVYIEGAPTPGAGVTIGDAYGLYVNANVHFGTATPGTSLDLNGGVGSETIGNNNTLGGVNIAVGNTNSGTSAYGGLWLQNDLADASGVNYGFLGMNSSTYTDTTFGTSTAIANQMYLYSTVGNLLIGSFKANSIMTVNLGGNATTNEVAKFSSTGAGLTIGLTGTTLGKIAFAGSTSTSITLQGQAVGSSAVVTLPAMTTTLTSQGNTTETTNTATVVAIAGVHHIHTITALASANTFGVPTIASGTLTNDFKLIIRIKDNGTARALSWNAIFRASSDLPLPSTTVISKTLYVGFNYNFEDTKWDLVAVLNNI